MKQIALHPISNGKYALVDDEDFYQLSQFKWFCYDSGNGYVYRYTSRAQGQKRRAILMHRQIMGEPAGIKIDHRDNNPLNNQRFNLRCATNSQNQGNRRVKRHKRSGSRFKGVHKSGWIATIQVNGKKKYLGTFDTEIDAARAYNKAALTHFGEFALLNPV